MACGVLGIVLKNEDEDLRTYAKVGLGALNHRGEDSHGVAFLNRKKVVTGKETGLVRDSKLFDREMLSGMLIGHTRYITSSSSCIQNAQPIRLATDSGVQYAISHNGNISNDADLKSFLRIDRTGISDTVVLGTLLGRSISKYPDIFDAMREDLDRAVGSYSLAILIGGKNPKLIATRDRFGYMPLFFGQNDRGFFVASEPVALSSDRLDAPCRPIAPGELLVMDKKGVETYQLFESKQRQFCMFQWVYMCRPDSQFEGTNVYEARENMGFRIANNYRPDVDCVVPIPDSGVSLGYGYSNATGVPIRMGLVKDRYESKRSFMQGNQQARVAVVSKKLSAIREVLAGKRVLLTDDSIVRATTIARTIKKVRAAGAVAVHVAVSCPPIISECYYGVDIYNNELAAREHMGKPLKEIDRLIAKKVGADSIYYPTIKHLVHSIGIRERDLCLSCLNGKYVQQIPATYDASGRKKG